MFPRKINLKTFILNPTLHKNITSKSKIFGGQGPPNPPFCGSGSDISVKSKTFEIRPWTAKRRVY